ncbi:MAG: iron-containing alcohol dehydrogenase [Nitrospinota bacterium]
MGSIRFRWTTPIFAGFGEIARLGREARKWGDGALLVTDRTLVELGHAERAEAALSEAGVRSHRFDRVVPNPTLDVVGACADRFREVGADLLVGLGGGSAMDAAKAAGVLVAGGGNLADYEGLGRIRFELPPLIALPTTAGTGSEVTPAAVVTDPDARHKVNLVSSSLVPRVAILDHDLVVGLPSPLAAETGMDALTHAIESFVSSSATPFSEALSRGALRLIAEHLRPFVANTLNREAAAGMHLAATLAGAAFANSGLGTVHALSHPLTCYHGIPHGLANALLLPAVLEYNLIADLPKFAEVAETLGEDIQGLPLREGASAAVEAIRNLIQDLALPSGLGELGMEETHLDAMAEDAIATSGTIPIDPRQADHETLVALYRAAM